MTWDWSGAYIHGIPQTEVINHCVEQVPKLTNGKLLHKPSFTQRLFLAGLNLFTSSIQTDWVGLWSNEDILNMKLFKENRYTGIILECSFYELDEVNSTDDYWGYTLWKNGVIKDWFLENPQVYLSETDILPFIPFIADFAKSQGVSFDGYDDFDYLRYLKSYSISD